MATISSKAVNSYQRKD